MDETEEYIDMCKKAIEIQKEKETMKETMTKNIKSVNIISPDFKGSFWFNMRNIDNDDWFWIPRQDQLQKIYLKYYYFSPSISEDSKLEYMLKQFSTLYESKKIVLPNSFEKAWLIFVMITIFHKIWKEDLWISIIEESLLL